MCKKLRVEGRGGDGDKLAGVRGLTWSSWCAWIMKRGKAEGGEVTGGLTCYERSSKCQLSTDALSHTARFRWPSFRATHFQPNSAPSLCRSFPFKVTSLKIHKPYDNAPSSCLPRLNEGSSFRIRQTSIGFFYRQQGS